MEVIDPGDIADKYLAESRSRVMALGATLNVVGFIATEDKPSIAYAKATRRVFTDAGFNYELRQVKRLELETEILTANEDKNVHGIFVYFPVFGNQEDDYLRDLVDYRKDIEAGSRYWTRKMSANDRLALDNNGKKKALLPCTPLAIVKILDDLGEYGTPASPLTNKKVTIFNRSEVIGRPLAVMMSNDGAEVVSFDEFGPLVFIDGKPRETSINRTEALAQSDIVITGVPAKNFCIEADELRKETLCVNFSSFTNFSEAVSDHVRLFVPRVGPMTVAMCMRNTIRLYENFHQ